MNKFPIIAAIAITAIFTLASCEQTQTPEQIKIAARQERIKTMEKMNKMSREEYRKLPEEERQKMIDIINKGRDENNEPPMMSVKEHEENAKRTKERFVEFLKKKNDSLKALQ